MTTKVILLLVAVGLAWFVAYPLRRRFLYGHAVPIEKYEKITMGMTRTAILEMLGPPRRVRHDTPDSTQFFYGGWLQFRVCNMEVYFGPDGRVTGTFHDGLSLRIFSRSAEPVGAASQSQPVGSQTNRTSAVAGSGR